MPSFKRDSKFCFAFSGISNDPTKGFAKVRREWNQEGSVGSAWRVGTQAPRRHSWQLPRIRGETSKTFFIEQIIEPIYSDIYSVHKNYMVRVESLLRRGRVVKTNLYKTLNSSIMHNMNEYKTSQRK